MVDTSSIDLPSTTSAQTIDSTVSGGNASSAQVTKHNAGSPTFDIFQLPDAAAMLQQLESANALMPEAIPTALVTFTTAPIEVPPTPMPTVPIQLASTAPQYVVEHGAGDWLQQNTWKWLSWIFVGLSLLVVVMVLVTFWQKGMRIQVLTTSTVPSFQSASYSY